MFNNFSAGNHKYGTGVIWFESQIEMQNVNKYIPEHLYLHLFKGLNSEYQSNLPSNNQNDNCLKIHF